MATTAWTGLIVQCLVLYHRHSSLPAALWIMSAFFTITTNLLVGAVFTGIAMDRTVLRSDWIVAGTMLSIVLVGVIYIFLLHGLVELSGGSAAANAILHYVTPVLAAIYWFFFARKGRLSWRDPLIWSIYPLAYLVYALARGAATGKYAYPFIDVAALGWGRTVLNAALIAVAYMLAGYAIVWIDARLVNRSHA